MFENKRLQYLIYALVAGLVMLVSITATLLLASHFRAGQVDDSLTRRALGVADRQPKHDQFAGDGACQDAIRKQVPGKILSLRLDQRAAKYDSFRRVNSLMYFADVVPPDTRFLSQQASTRPFEITCESSADDNTVLHVTVFPAEE